MYNRRLRGGTTNRVGFVSVVWEGRHLVDGTVVVIKEIAMARLSKNLQDSLKFRRSVRVLREEVLAKDGLVVS